MTIILVPFTPSHLAYFPAITDSSWTRDTNTLMKNSVRGTTWLSDMFKPMYESLIENPRVQIVVAVDSAIGNVPVGWCIWAFRGFAGEQLESLKRFTEEDDAVRLDSPSDDERAGAMRKNAEPLEGVPGPPFDFTEEEKQRGMERIDAMEETTSMDEMMGKLMPEGCKCLYIYSITVSPGVQGSGVGSALAQWGMRRCDSVGTYAWMHASEAARFLFEKQGWDVVERQEVDLDEWDPRPEGKRSEGKWGKYTFRYFRWPTVEERKKRQE